MMSVKSQGHELVHVLQMVCQGTMKTRPCVRRLPKEIGFSTQQRLRLKVCQWPVKFSTSDNKTELQALRHCHERYRTNAPRSVHNSILIISQRKNYPDQQTGWRRLKPLCQEIIPELPGYIHHRELGDSEHIRLEWVAGQGDFRSCAQKRMKQVGVKTCVPEQLCGVTWPCWCPVPGPALLRHVCAEGNVNRRKHRWVSVRTSQFPGL